MQPKNNARIKCVSIYAPIHNVVCVDEDQNIWKGERVIEEGTPIDFASIIYFSRSYYPDDYLNDKVFTEVEFGPELLGFPFVLVPKEKILFSYDPPSIISRPDIKLSKSKLQGF